MFTEPFQRHHIEMAEAILSATTYAGDQAIAAPRGEGKTTLAEGVMLYAILTGTVTFAVLFAATASDARNSLASVKEYLAASDRLLADYPEICVPVRAVAGTPQLAHSCRVNTSDEQQVEAFFQWSGEEITMPRVPGSACAGAIIAIRGLDSAVRGLKKGSRRPELALIDDPDTEDTARSEEQAKKLETRIDRAIAGLAPKGKRMSRVMLTTLQNLTCVSATFTDPKLKPSWQGKRFAFLLHPPDRADMWDEYISLRQSSMMDGDPFARPAAAFYRRRRKAMDAGAKVANPLSFDGRRLADGTKLQLSAIQRYHDFVADNGEEAALCELQNNPPEESAPVESGISAYRVQRQLNGYPRRIVPPGCTVVTQGIDVRKIALHFVVRAWQPGATGFTIDYGVQEVRGTIRGSDEGLEHAIFRALQERRQDLEDNPYTTPDGEIVPVTATLVDAGWQTSTIYHFTKTAGLGWWPAMGFGKSNGCVKTSFNMPSKDNPGRKSGDNWFLTYQKKPGVWLVASNADVWKAWEHARWLTDPSRPGALTNYGDGSGLPRMSDDEKAHFSYGKHIASEAEAEQVIKGLLVRRWKAKSDTNHYLDASYMADIAANMKGIRLLSAYKQPRRRVKLSEMQAQKRKANA